MLKRKLDAQELEKNRQIIKAQEDERRRDGTRSS
jgi:hypothetical protein